MLDQVHGPQRKALQLVCLQGLTMEEVRGQNGRVNWQRSTPLLSRLGSSAGSHPRESPDGRRSNAPKGGAQCKTMSNSKNFALLPQLDNYHQMSTASLNASHRLQRM